MRPLIAISIALLLLTPLGTFAQSPEDERAQNQSIEDQPVRHSSRPRRSPGKEVASGAGNVGVGAAKGAGALAKGTANGAVSLATLHPIDAGVSVGKGAVVAGKDVTVGTVKGTAKIAHGTGRALKKIL